VCGNARLTGRGNRLLWRYRRVCACPPESYELRMQIPLAGPIYPVLRIHVTLVLEFLHDAQRRSTSRTDMRSCLSVQYCVYTQMTSPSRPMLRRAVDTFANNRLSPSTAHLTFAHVGPERMMPQLGDFLICQLRLKSSGGLSDSTGGTMHQRVFSINASSEAWHDTVLTLC
jgi:hypothetical protein